MSGPIRSLELACITAQPRRRAIGTQHSKMHTNMLTYETRRTADSRQRTTGSRHQPTGSRQRTTDTRERAPDSRQQAADNGQQTTDNRQRPTGNKKQTTDNGQATFGAATALDHRRPTRVHIVAAQRRERHIRYIPIETYEKMYMMRERLF